MNRHTIAIARAVGVIGAVSAVVVGITFANLQSAPVTLSPNTLVSATAALAIGPGATCPTGNTTSTTGLAATLTPGVASTPFNFCLDNTGSIPMTVTAQITTSLGSSPIPANQVTLAISCPTIGNLSGTLDQYANPVSFPGSQLAVTTPEDCSATATLNSSYSGTGNQTVTPFDIAFVGNQ